MIFIVYENEWTNTRNLKMNFWRFELGTQIQDQISYDISHFSMLQLARLWWNYHFGSYKKKTFNKKISYDSMQKRLVYTQNIYRIWVRLPKVVAKQRATQIDDYDVHKAAIWNIINAVEKNVREKYRQLSHDMEWKHKTTEKQQFSDVMRRMLLSHTADFNPLCFCFCHYSNCFLLFTILCYRFESFSDSCCCCFCRLSHSFTPLHVNFQF
jgi:hypothetical protein